MSRIRPGVAAPLIAASLLTGCGLLDPPTLTGSGYDAVTVTAGGTTWLGTDLCLEGGDAEVSIDDVVPREVGGIDADDLDVRVAWAPLLVAERVDHHRGRLPPGYQPAAGATGEIGACDNPDGNAWLVVGFPDRDRPVWLEDLELGHTVDGEPATATIKARWVQCPIWSRVLPGEREDACRRLNRMGS